MQMHIEEKDVIYMYLVIAVIYTSSVLLPSIAFTMKNIVAFVKGANVDDDDSNKKIITSKKEEKETKSKLFLVLLRETFIIIVCILVCVLCVYIVVFFYLFSTTPTNFNDNFQKTLTFLKEFLWRDGNLLPIYVPFIASIFVVFLVMSFYIAGNNEFVQGLAYANNDISDQDKDENDMNTDENVKSEDDTDLPDEINVLKLSNFGSKKMETNKDNVDANNETDGDATDDPNLDTTLRIPGMDVSKSDMFRRYYMLMIMLIGLFILMLMFIRFWDTDKATFAMYTTFLAILMICAIVSTKGRYWRLTFYVALATCAAINYFSIMKTTEK
jgi:uncharacterized membrane protein